MTIFFCELQGIGILLGIDFSPGIDDAIEKQKQKPKIKQVCLSELFSRLGKNAYFAFHGNCFSAQTFAVIHKSVIVHCYLCAGAKQSRNCAGQSKKRSYVSLSKGDKLGRVIIPLILF